MFRCFVAFRFIKEPVLKNITCKVFNKVLKNSSYMLFSRYWNDTNVQYKLLNVISAH